MALSYPPTVIIRHPKESPQKCSIVPLKGRQDVQILLHPVETLPPLEGYIRLAELGPPLSEADRACGILLLDCCWRRVGTMLDGVDHLPARSLHGWRTAYPRVSKRGTDPGNGLASVEALYLAYHILGRSTAGLLDHYHWAEKFLKENGLPDDKPDAPAKEN